MNREAALQLMQEHTQSPSLRQHMLAVEAALRAYALHYSEDQESWGLVGLLHDFDYERYPNAAHSPTEEHPSWGVRLLRERGLPEASQFEISSELSDDMARGWDHGELTSADAFYYYYSNFTRDQDDFEARLKQLRTPVKVVWGADDFYIKKEMGIELANRIHAELKLLPGIGHYAHLQSPEQTVAEIRATLP